MRRAATVQGAGVVLLATLGLAACSDDPEVFCDRAEAYRTAVTNLETFSFQRGDLDLDDLEDFRDAAPDGLQDEADLVVDYLIDLHEVAWEADGEELQDALREVSDGVDQEAWSEAAEALETQLRESCG